MTAATDAMGYWKWLIHKFKAAYQTLKCLTAEMHQSFQQDLTAANAFARCFIVLIGGFFGIIGLARLIAGWPSVLTHAILVIAAFFWLSYLAYTLETYLEDDP